MRTVESVKAAASWLAGPHETKPVSILRTMLPIRGLAIALVALAHACISMLAAEVSAEPGSSLTPVLFGAWQVASFPKSMILELCRCAVPLFLFLAGYFMQSTPGSWKAIWISCRKLLLPLATWSLAGLAFSWRKGVGGWGPAEFFCRLASGKTQTGYFFIVLIIQFYALSKWLLPMMRKRPGTTLFLSFALQGAVHAYDATYMLMALRLCEPVAWMLRTGSFPEFLFPRFMASFSLGIWASVRTQRFKDISSRLAVIAAAAAAAAALVALERGLVFYRCMSALGMDAFSATATSWAEWKTSLALWNVVAVFLVFGYFRRRVPMKSLLDYLGKYSFQIFLMHGMVLDLSKALLYKVCANTRFYGAAGCALLFACELLAPIALTKAIQKHLPARARALLLGA